MRSRYNFDDSSNSSSNTSVIKAMKSFFSNKSNETEVPNRNENARQKKRNSNSNLEAINQEQTEIFPKEFGLPKSSF